jgi:hypothetical protein
MEDRNRMNLNHFCDPTLDYWKDVHYTMAENFPFVEHMWPVHDACQGKAVIDFGLETELIVRCDCSCHHWGWTDISLNTLRKTVE